MLLTLESAVERAQAGSPAADIARLQFEQSLWNYRTYRTAYLPAFSLTGAVPGLERAINEIVQDDGSVRYIPQSQTSSTVRLAVSQPIPYTGGNVFVSSRLGRIDLFGNRDSYQWQASPVVVGVTQPILQFNQMKWDRRMEPLRYTLARRSYVENLAQSAVEVTDLFFDVVIAQMEVENASFNVAVNDTIYVLSQGRFELGKIAENDLLQSELQLLNAQTALSEAQIAYDRAVQDLKIALGLPYDQALAIVPPYEILSLELDLSFAVAQARDRRAAFKILELQQLQADQEVSRTRFENRFSANLTASFGLNQSAQYLGDAYGNLLNQQRFTISFEMPLYQWGGGRASFEAALAEQEQTRREIALEREELEQEVYFETLQYMQLQQQVRLAAKADTIAARRFEVARNRYTIGKIDITDLFDAQLAKDQARQAYIRTLREYWLSYYRLRRLTHYDFVLDQPLGNAQ